MAKQDQRFFDLTNPDDYATALAQEILLHKVRDEAKRAYAASLRPPAKQPEILSLRERLKRPRKKNKWRITGCQQTGQKIVLVAQYKAGKTTLSGNLIRSLLDGDPFLDTYDAIPLNPGETVVVLDFAMDTEQIEEWHGDQKIDDDDRFILITMKGSASTFNILDEKIRNEWAKKFKEEFNAKYLILDCLRPLMDALGLNEHLEAGILFGALDALLLEAEIPEAVVIHHMGHKGEHGRGDSRIQDWPDVTWKLTRADENPASPRFFSAYGRDVDVSETALKYDSVTRYLSIEKGEDGKAGGSRFEVEVAAAMVALLKYIRDQNLTNIYPSVSMIEKHVKSLTEPKSFTQKALRVARAKADDDGLICDAAAKSKGTGYMLAEFRDGIMSELINEIEKL